MGKISTLAQRKALLKTLTSMDPQRIKVHTIQADDEPALFFSDVHLGSPKAPPQKKILHLLEHHASREVRTIFILGDLFDFWYGYKSVVFSHFLPLLLQMGKLTEKGIKIHYLAGNHDFCLGSAFSEHLGVQTYDGALDVSLGKQRLYLAHGDLINPEDIGYRILHRVVRSRGMDWLIRLIPPDFGWYLAMAASRTSRAYSSKIRWKRTEIFHRYAQKVFDLGYDGVMMGHSHFPELTQIQSASRPCLIANTGDWIKNDSYILYTPGKGLALERWST